MLSNNEWLNKEVKEEIKKFLETNGNEHNSSKPMGHIKGSPEGEDLSNTGLLKRKHFK